MRLAHKFVVMLALVAMVFAIEVALVSVPGISDDDDDEIPCHVHDHEGNHSGHDDDDDECLTTTSTLSWRS